MTRIYTGDDGRSHFEDLCVPSTSSYPPAFFAATLPVRTALLLETEKEAEVGRHNAPRRQLVVNLSGTCIIECAHETRVFGPGEIRLADDMTGEGHVTTVLDDVRALVLPLADELDISEWERRQ